MSGDEPISVWIGQLKQGDSASADHLWRHFFTRLLDLTCKKLSGRPLRAADEEDIVLSAFETIFRRAQAGEFPRLNDRQDLWRLLVAVTERKAINQFRDESRQKRGGGRALSESLLRSSTASDSVNGLACIPSPEPTPEFAALMAEAVERLLAMLDDEHRNLALLKLEGHSNEEIAARIDRSVPTVERRLKLIRAKWRAEVE